jgi:hypothetical protein
MVPDKSGVSARSPITFGFVSMVGPCSRAVRASAKVRGRATHHYAVAFAVPLRNASRSVLIVSASVVGMPCGKPL